MKREVIVTSDGSSTLHLPEWDETYHSRHGAIQEASHVFIQEGLSQMDKPSVSVLEIGFGTGLNCFLTFLEANKRGLSISYTGVEAFPVLSSEVSVLNYPELIGGGQEAFFRKMHELPWNIPGAVSEDFRLTKLEQRFEEFSASDAFDLVYYDAFGFRVQPELWSEEMFRSMFRSLKPGGLLVTYASRTLIRRNLKNAGFGKIETLAGPPGKREMTRAVKPE